MEKLTLGYWGFRGLVQPIRYLLAYSGLKFEEIVYKKHEEWHINDKHNLGLDFPNLPYLLDGNLKIT